MCGGVHLILSPIISFNQKSSIHKNMQCSPLKFCSSRLNLVKLSRINCQQLQSSWSNPKVSKIQITGKCVSRLGEVFTRNIKLEVNKTFIPSGTATLERNEKKYMAGYKANSSAYNRVQRLNNYKFHCALLCVEFVPYTFTMSFFIKFSQSMIDSLKPINYQHSQKNLHLEKFLSSAKNDLQRKSMNRLDPKWIYVLNLKRHALYKFSLSESNETSSKRDLILFYNISLKEIQSKSRYLVCIIQD